ncbi:MAG: fold metallo-hydrolase [Proteobacteria bacterium]|nr:fold metallo-hydrolase [Pseudomonadota bacterium]
MFDWRDYGNGIIAFDAGYVRPILAAIHMIVDDGRVAFIDTGSNDSLPNVLEALNKVGLGREAVDYVILTHIHLDHAGGAGALMREFPNARLVVHPRGSRHMAEPSKLVAGVTAVYGKDYVDNVYGDILPISAERIIDAHEGLTIQLGGRELLMIDTPGHAKHHTTQFDHAEMRASIDRLMSYGPQAMYLTHYAQVHDVPARAADLHRRLDAHVAIAEAHAAPSETRHAAIKQELTAYLLAELRTHGCTLPEATILDILATDIELNVQGLTWWMDHRG